MINFSDNEVAGLLPFFVDPADPRPAAEQLHSNYGHGGGWRPQEGWTLTFNAEEPLLSTMEYAGDPLMTAVSYAVLRDETLVLFDYGYLAVIQPDAAFEMSRMD